MDTVKIAIITGASRGIGEAVAERLARDGFIVIVNCLGGLARAESVVSAIEAFGGMARVIQADVSDPVAMKRMFDRVEQEFGGVDVLVNNAGIMELANIVNTDDDAFNRHIAVNLKGAFNAIREAARRIRRGGRIINMSSSVASLYPATYGIYAATMAGVEAMTRILSKELHFRDITVNAVAPGPAARHLLPESTDDIKHATPHMPLGRIDDAQDIAAIVAFLAGPDAGSINGQVIGANDRIS